MTSSPPADAPLAATPLGDASLRETSLADDTDGSAEPTPAVDGRTARADRTRAAIVDALLELIEEGDLQPPASRIAQRAGISLRLIYHHFGDLESLFRAASNREAEKLATITGPSDPTRPLDERIEQLIDQRAAQMELITPVRRASILQEPFSEELRGARDALYAIAAQLTLALFEPELAAMEPARRDAVSNALSVVLLWGLWNDLRTTGCTVDETKAALRAIVRGLLVR